MSTRKYQFGYEKHREKERAGGGGGGGEKKIEKLIKSQIWYFDKFTISNNKKYKKIKLKKLTKEQKS